MTRITKTTILMLTVLLTGMTFVATAREKEEEIAVEDLPAAVTVAVQKAFPGGAIQRAEKEMEENGLVYEVKVRMDSKVLEVEVSPAGKILEVEEDDDEDADEERGEQNENDDDDAEEIAIKDLPKAVVDAVQKALPGGVIEEAEKEVEEGKVIYEVEVEVGKKEFEVEISPEGKTLEIEEEDEHRPSTSSPRASHVHRSLGEQKKDSKALNPLVILILLIFAICAGMTLRHYKETGDFLPSKLMEAQ